jgi:hypothetical protein
MLRWIMAISLGLQESHDPASNSGKVKPPQE